MFGRQSVDGAGVATVPATEVGSKLLKTRNDHVDAAGPSPPVLPPPPFLTRGCRKQASTRPIIVHHRRFCAVKTRRPRRLRLTGDLHDMGGFVRAGNLGADGRLH